MQTVQTLRRELGQKVVYPRGRVFIVKIYMDRPHFHQFNRKKSQLGTVKCQESKEEIYAGGRKNLFYAISKIIGTKKKEQGEERQSWLRDQQSIFMWIDQLLHKHLFIVASCQKYVRVGPFLGKGILHHAYKWKMKFFQHRFHFFSPDIVIGDISFAIKFSEI